MTDYVDGAYSESMDFDDFDDISFENEVSMNNNSRNNDQEQISPLKIRKKPGRKPNPASPALRKAQNRAAQRAFRERKEKHMKDLEHSMKSMKERHEKLLNDNRRLSNENNILKSENWYLKGIVLSLQLVCFQHNLVIPQHCPHVNEQTLSVLAQSIPESIASYLNVNARNKVPFSQKVMNGTTEVLNLSLPPDVTQTQSITEYYSQFLAPGSLIITKDGVHKIPDKDKSVRQNGWYNNVSSEFAQEELNMPPLSPMSDKEKPEVSSTDNNIHQSKETAISNMAAIQILRLRLRLQSACVNMRAQPITIQPTLLQLTIPHDPRIDLIATPHMRDRMILFRDQFDLDDCFHLLLNGSVFHGGDPAIAGNWELPPEFFEKYWFLTIDYNLRRYTNEWRKKQGLNELQSNLQLTNNNASSIYKLPQQPPTNHNKKDNLVYNNLPHNFDAQMNIDSNQQSNLPLPPQQQQSSITPIQLTDGNRMVNPNNIINPITAQQPINSVLRQQMPESYLEFKNYNMNMLAGIYNENNINTNNNNTN